MIITMNFLGEDVININSSFKLVNGLINKLLGENNSFHGKYSNYSISKLQGGKYKDGKIIVSDDVFITVSSNDEDFLSTLISGILTYKDNLFISKLKFDKFDISNFNVNNGYDIILTSSPIRLNNKERFLTYLDDEFIDYLTEKSIKKLIHNGLDEDIANTLRFELFHPENGKVYFNNINGAKTISSKIMLIVRGNKEARKLIYELGLGNCTGFGFGSVKLLNF